MTLAKNRWAIACAFLLAISLLFSFGVSDSADSQSVEVTSHPFKPGEHFVYNISWSKFINAGVGTLSVVREGKRDGKRAYLFSIQGRTTGLVGTIFPINDRTMAWFDIKNARTLYTDIRIAENRYRKHKTMTFDHEALTVIYRINSRPAQVHPILPGTVGPVSALYKLRMTDGARTVGKTLYIPLFDQRKMYNLKITIVGKERIKLPVGVVDTIKTVVDLKTEGVFRRKGKMTIWFSDDFAFAPVQIQTKLPIGSMFGSLTEYRGTTIDALTPNEDFIYKGALAK